MRLDGSLQWQKEGDNWHLCHGEELLVCMGKENNGIRSIRLEGRNFKCVLKSGWTSHWKIYNENNEELLALKFGFWSSKGKTRFKDGSVFECKYQTLPQFSIDFKDLRYGEKIISYQIDKTTGHTSPKLICYVSEMFTDKFLFLISIGMALFMNLYRQEFDFTAFFLSAT